MCIVIYTYLYIYVLSDGEMNSSKTFNIGKHKVTQKKMTLTLFIEIQHLSCLFLFRNEILIS